MILYHYTNDIVLPIALMVGLTPSAATGRMKVIWLVTHSKREWARNHVAKHHGQDPASLSVICLDIPRSWLRRIRRGVWVTHRRIHHSWFLGYAT